MHKNIKKFIFLFVILIQVAIIGSILNRIFYIRKATKVLGSSDVIVENGKSIFKPANSNFESYFELKPSTVDEDVRWWDSTKVYYNINDDGLNERFNYEQQKPEGVFRIITLGDSFTYGQYVDTEKNWPEKLEDMLNDKKICEGSTKYEVINLGVGGFDVPYIIKRLEEKGLKYTPNLILWFESGSGYYRDREKMDPLIKKCKDEVMEKNDTDSVSMKDHNECWIKARDENISKSSFNYFKDRTQYWMDYLLKITNEVPVVVGSSSYIEPPHEKLLREIDTNRDSFFYTNKMTLISLEEDTMISEFDGHPSEVGHRKYAEDFFKYITSNDKFGVTCK